MKKILLIFLMILSQISYAQSDCGSALAVCGNSNISYTPSGFGNIQENPLGGGCLSLEHFSVWYTFTASTSGTLTFLITPNVNPANPTNTDYDWAVFGPNKQCGALGSPLRCSYASTASGVLTGLNMTATDLTEGAGGDGFCRYLDVIAGETYYLIVDNFSANTNGFVLSWGGTATLSSPFTSAVQPHPFIPPGTPSATPNGPNEVIICADPAVFDFSSLSAGIINGNPNFVVSYHTSSNDALTGNNPITTPQTVNTTTVYYYSISYLDPVNPNSPISKCKQTGTFKFIQGNITASDATLTECNNNNMGTAIFDLTSAPVYGNPSVKKYYPTMNDLNNNTNEILNPANYVSSTGTVFVNVTTPQGCSDSAQITLNFYPVVVVTEATLRSCFIESNPSTASFNLTAAAVTTQTGITKKYYPSVTDAVNSTNEITNPTTYIAPNGVVYVKVINGNGCYGVAKVNLIVLPPVYSTVLQDKIICVEDKTTLDAGPGFASYEWSTGAITQVITNVGVGTYWVKLKTGECISTQTVKVYPSEQPVISNIDIANNVVTVTAIGGTPPYQYSMDNINWQTSNVFNNVPRGDGIVYVKDAYDCEPINVTIVVPNLVNVITPNGDGVNDVIDYSALAGKQNLIFNIYDRYGTKIFQADKHNGYKWDGTTGGKKVSTGTYWYSVTWNENDKKNTPFKYSGWVMVKNRE
ncbi:gliding motility-associated C-terminal domain-containing protein [Chryseobacterium soldanellicola]|uniref:Gliding motility-associated C-terminal domain-containing protein n=1 Tax=Chryseobacterium soldanellicola TaxID=311333 RepID=A0A1H1A9Q6_9FLAO|nr:gliding motility-associated C-terminal domain-containing protein [Chryseobacterium soldanellicola]SDQ36374.1 gliding motility-associated C-terminal domain-containing protein [Chryseobacterium soldanellicola]